MVDLGREKKDIEIQAIEAIWPFGCRFEGRKQLRAESSVCSEQLCVTGGPCGLVKQQGKNVLDAQMLY